MKYSKSEKAYYLILAAFLFWFLFQLWGMPSALCALFSSWLLPPLIYKKKYSFLTGAFVLIVLLFGTVLLYSNVNVPIVSVFPNKPPSQFILRSISSFLIVAVSAGLGTMVVFLINRVYREKEIQKLENEKLEAELSLLKAQINPHFLFNSLNTIYYQIDKGNRTARETLAKFSELLRYQLYHSDKKVIDISKEAEFIKTYIELQKLRMNSNYKIEYKEIGTISGFSIAPLLLIPLIENSFKHGSHYTDKQNEIGFVLERQRGRFFFTSYNTIEDTSAVKNINGHTDGGIGLNNVKKRLQLLYPDNYNLLINKEETFFEIHLSINIA